MYGIDLFSLYQTNLLSGWVYAEFIPVARYRSKYVPYTKWLCLSENSVRAQLDYLKLRPVQYLIWA